MQRVTFIFIIIICITPTLLDGLLLECERQRVPARTLLSILSDLNNVVAWMVSNRPLISKSSSPFKNPLATVLSVPIKIGITVTFMFNSFFNSQARSRYLSLLAFFQFSSVVSRDVKVNYYYYYYYLPIRLFSVFRPFSIM